MNRMYSNSEYATILFFHTRNQLVMTGCSWTVIEMGITTLPSIETGNRGGMVVLKAPHAFSTTIPPRFLDATRNREGTGTCIERMDLSALANFIRILHYRQETTDEMDHEAF
uniref:Uncharacterized protein n=1 Tax=Ascaris lumbricoides TaxID=6252 RepID=A0A0M3IQD3_ASCLU